MASNQLASMTGPRGMASLLSNPAIQSSLPPDWANVYGAVQNSPAFASERARYPTITSAKVNAVYDSMARSRATMTDYFGKSNARLGQIEQLRLQIATAPDPAAKADLQSRMVAEQNAIQGTSQLLSILKEKQKQDLEDANRLAHKDFLCSEFKKTC